MERSAAALRLERRRFAQSPIESPRPHPSAAFIFALAGLLLAAWPAQGRRPRSSGAAGQNRVCQVAFRTGRLVRRPRLERASGPDPGLVCPPRSQQALSARALENAAGGDASAGTPPEVVEWNNRFGQLKRDQADALYKLVRQAVHAQRSSLAYELALLALAENPDHDVLRRVMGYQKYKGQWCTFYEGRKFREGKVWHPKFGWVPQSHVARYEQGLRLAGGKWISAEDDARLHDRSESGWIIETEHYMIQTDHSLEAGDSSA